MAKAAALSFLLLFFSFLSGRDLVAVNGQKTWCVPKPSADAATLTENLNYACGQVNCGVIQKGNPCFDPDNLFSHASVAMNLYYNSVGKNKWNCDFKGSGLIVTSDPSHGGCQYP